MQFKTSTVHNKLIIEDKVQSSVKTKYTQLQFRKSVILNTCGGRSPDSVSAVRSASEIIAFLLGNNHIVALDGRCLSRIRHYPRWRWRKRSGSMSEPRTSIESILHHNRHASWGRRRLVILGVCRGWHSVLRWDILLHAILGVVLWRGCYRICRSSSRIWLTTNCTYWSAGRLTRI